MGIIAAVTGWVASTFAVSAATAGIIVNIGASVLLSAASRALAGSPEQPSAQDLKRELAQPTTEPAYRFNYGITRAQGTPVGTPVKGRNIWGCWLLDSRSSALDEGLKIFIDEREVEWSGNPFDFSGGGGAVATNGKFSGHMEFWISRGEQSRPPRFFTDNAGYSSSREDLWKTSDGWQGRTVIWVRFQAGDNDERQERWPNTPPLVAVEGKWSKVWDPRDPAQDATDPATWKWSDNHALCVLDVLRNNPIRQYRAINLHLQSFIDAADASDEIVAKKDGTEKRYRAAGTQTFDRGEIEDQINPLVLSGAADLVRIGGTLAIAPGVWREPEVELTYMLGEGFSAPDMLPGSELVNELRVSYLAPSRGYETAELYPWSIPGALAQDGGIPAPKDLELSFCPSPTQAMRVRKVVGLRMRRQERLEGGQLPPEAFDLVAGANAALSLPSPYSVLDGIYEIQSLHPAMDPIGREGVALRMPAALVKTGPSIYTWDPATEEEDVISQAYDGARQGIQVPGAISVTTGEGVNLNTGGTVIPRIRFAFSPSPSGSVEGYEYQSRDAGGIYGTSGIIDSEVLDGNGRVFGFIEGSAGQSYDIRVRAGSPYGKSDWTEYLGATMVGPNIVLSPPVLAEPPTVTATTVTIQFQTQNDADTTALEVWGSDTDTANPAIDATLLATFSLGANRSAEVTESGLTSGQTRYYFARSRGPFDSASPFSASVSVTTT